MVSPKNRSEEHTSELQSHSDLVCRLLLEKKKDSDIVSAVQFEKHTDFLAIIGDARLVRGLPCLVVCLLVRVNVAPFYVVFFFFFNDTATTEIYPLSLHDALPILFSSSPSSCPSRSSRRRRRPRAATTRT